MRRNNSSADIVLRQRALELALEGERMLHEARREERLSIVARARLYFNFMKAGTVPRDQEVAPSLSEVQE